MRIVINRRGGFDRFVHVPQRKTIDANQPFKACRSLWIAESS
jgi:hypothetical protein